MNKDKDELTDEELEEKLESSYQKHQKSKNVFQIIRNEKSSQDLRSKQIKFKKKEKTIK